MRVLFSGIRLLVFLLLAVPSALPASNGRVVADSGGIQVLEVWGTNRQMGEALAAFQGPQI
ncbi:MAG: hypothetical protein JXQ83_12415, partial [Candidatus Glassbacteria bacterium]|nr:hypothetical protein [Candidatus Glassbacteria bacterium]